jgi:KaiC/GvpD/RAD55 family RecA-like ATPase
LDHKSKFVETGIGGLDRMLNGGIPVKNQVLVSGAPGIGKTTMSMQMLYNCASNGLPSVFISLDQKPESILRNFRLMFPAMSEVDRFIKEGTMVIEGYETAAKIAANTEFESSYSMGNLISEMDGIIRSANARVVAVDSLSFLKLMLGNTILYNKSVASLVANLRRLDVTSLLTKDTPYYGVDKMKFGQEDLLFDGMISLFKERDDNMYMQIVKMRGTLHGRGLSQYDITSNGIALK